MSKGTEGGAGCAIHTAGPMPHVAVAGGSAMLLPTLVGCYCGPPTVGYTACSPDEVLGLKQQITRWQPMRIMAVIVRQLMGYALRDHLPQFVRVVCRSDAVAFPQVIRVAAVGDEYPARRRLLRWSVFCCVATE